ncbi:MAG: rhodanese-like domain-containing protein [Bacteroidetes bacterium]|nr:rhodanese-like domain-containing protein [Bacteroidota bacterium]
MKFFFTVLALVFSFSGFSQLRKNVDAATFKKLIDEKKYVLIDLRTPDEIKSKGKIKGATEIDFLDKNAETNIQKLDKNKRYLIYCAGGGRSSDCADLMQKQGFKEVVNLEKGFGDWKNKGFEIETK